jgi:hypothetical protein
MDTTDITTTEQPAAAAVETPVERTPVESTGSLADHREQFPSEKRSTRAVEAARQAVQAEQAPAVVEKKRNRARSQDASPDELKQISALGREAREIEEAVSESLGLKAREGESPRLFELRRRKEIAEAVKTLKAAPVVAEVPRASTSILSTTSDAKEPDASDGEKYPYGVADPKYLKDLTAFTVSETIRSEETKRQTAQLEKDQADGRKAFAARWTAAKAEIPDFEAIASKPVPWEKGSPIDLWIWSRNYGPKLLWYLNSPAHQAETREIMALPVEDQLERLVAIGNGLQKTPAGVNGNNRSVEPATVVTPSPRLPTPVKTGPMTRSSEPPDPSKMSLRQFRETYHANTRRRR